MGAREEVSERLPRPLPLCVEMGRLHFRVAWPTGTHQRVAFANGCVESTVALHRPGFSVPSPVSTATQRLPASSRGSLPLPWGHCLVTGPQWPQRGLSLDPFVLLGSGGHVG